MCPEGCCDPVESPQWSRFASKTCDSMMDPGWSSPFLKNCSPWKETYRRNSWRTVCCGMDPTLEQGESVSRKERQRQRVLNWLPPLFPTTHTPLGEEAGKLGVRWSLGRREGLGEAILMFVLTSHYPTLFNRQQIRLISPSRVCFACDSSCWVSNCSTHELLIVFSPTVLLGGSDRAAWKAPGTQPQSTHHNWKTDTSAVGMEQD